MFFLLYKLSRNCQRLSIELIDFISDLSGDASFARMTIEAYINYGDNLISAKTNFICKDECLKGKFNGDLDVRNAYSESGVFELVINIHGYTQDKFKLKLISLGDLILSSKVLPNSEGKIQKILNVNILE